MLDIYPAPMNIIHLKKIPITDKINVGHFHPAIIKCNMEKYDL